MNKRFLHLLIFFILLFALTVFTAGEQEDLPVSTEPPSLLNPSVPTSGSTHPVETETTGTAATAPEPTESAPTDTTATTPEPTESVPTDTTATTPEPTESTPAGTAATTPKPTTPAPTGGGQVGNLYTRAQLEALDSTRQGYGQGTQVDSKNRPILATQIQQKYGKYDAHFIGPDNNKVYLTFSLGYEHKNLTADVLDTLKNKKVKGVFFVNYEYATDNPEILKRIINEGHILANHATHHYDMGTVSIDTMISEIMTIHNYIRDTYQYEMKLFHPPSGYFNEQLLAVAQNLGYKTVNWSFAYKDWDTGNQPNPTAALKKLNKAVHSGAIYSLHTVSSTNTAILGDFIDATRAKGLEFALFQ